METRTRKRNVTHRATICLCMMVRDESAIIVRALQSVRPYVNKWSIVDTGSTDDTRELIWDCMDGVPGDIWTHPWQNFAVGRTEAASKARGWGCDYILVMDADQTLVVSDPKAFAGLKADVYNLQIHHGTLVYPHPWLLSTRRLWKWEGATHEALIVPAGYTQADLAGAYLVEHADSHRRVTGAKLSEDRALLEAAYAEDPTDARTVFYLAQQCQDEGRYPCAIKHYQERIALGGWPEEVWCAQYRIGMIRERMAAWPLALEAHMEAWRMAPDRAEPIYRLGRACLMNKHFGAALMFFREAACLAKPTGRLFLEPDVYDYASWWGASMAQRLLGRHEEAERLEESLIASGKCPQEAVEAILAQRESKSIGRPPG